MGRRLADMGTKKPKESPTRAAFEKLAALGRALVEAEKALPADADREHWGTLFDAQIHPDQTPGHMVLNAALKALEELNG